MKNVTVVLVTLLLAACGGKKSDSGDTMGGSGAMADSAASMPMQGSMKGSGAMADSAHMTSDTTMMKHDTGGMGGGDS